MKTPPPPAGDKSTRKVLLRQAADRQRDQKKLLEESDRHRADTEKAVKASRAVLKRAKGKGR